MAFSIDKIWPSHIADEIHWLQLDPSIKLLLYLDVKNKWATITSLDGKCPKIFNENTATLTCHSTWSWLDKNMSMEGYNMPTLGSMPFPYEESLKVTHSKGHVNFHCVMHPSVHQAMDPVSNFVEKWIKTGKSFVDNTNEHNRSKYMELFNWRTSRKRPVEIEYEHESATPPRVQLFCLYANQSGLYELRESVLYEGYFVHPLKGKETWRPFPNVLKMTTGGLRFTYP